MTPRSQRNNNPGNIEIGQPWLGLMPADQMSTEQAAEKRFAVFKSPAWGFRALAVIILNYNRKYGINTIGGIIKRWAPPTENNTHAYIMAVCRATGRMPSDPLDLKDYMLLESIAKAIATHEAGGWYFTDADLHAGVAMALQA